MLTKFQDIEAFRQLRIDPYYGKISEVHPRFKPQVDALVTAMLSRRQTLVHGDYSPKNMLVTGQEIFLIDFEVVHCGDPSFDTAFFLNHLFLKALRFREHQGLYLQCVRNFWRRYADGDEGRGSMPVGEEHAGTPRLFVAGTRRRKVSGRVHHRRESETESPATESAGFAPDAS